MRIERIRGTASDIHGRDLPPEPGIWVFEVEAPALVLGSTQPAMDIPGVDVVRRRSGGGAVWVEPVTTLWVDVVVPRGDVRWDDDVGRATHWLGDAWAAALGRDDTRVHRGAMQRSELSGLVCFAGLGPGEVTADGRKLVGISQRRTREAARFQCVAYERWDPAPLAVALGLEPAVLEGMGDGVGPITTVLERFVQSL